MLRICDTRRPWSQQLTLLRIKGEELHRVSFIAWNPNLTRSS